MLFFPTKEEIQLVERKHIFSLEKGDSRNKEVVPNTAYCLLSSGEGIPLEHAKHQFYLDEREKRALSGCVLQRTEIFGTEEAMKKTKKQTFSKPRAFAIQVNFWVSRFIGTL